MRVERHIADCGEMCETSAAADESVSERREARAAAGPSMSTRTCWLKSCGGGGGGEGTAERVGPGGRRGALSARGAPADGGARVRSVLPPPLPRLSPHLQALEARRDDVEQPLGVLLGAALPRPRGARG